MCGTNFYMVFCGFFPLNWFLLIYTHHSLTTLWYSLTWKPVFYVPIIPSDRFQGNYFFFQAFHSEDPYICLWYDLFRVYTYKWIRSQVHFHSIRYCQNVLQSGCMKFLLPPFPILPTFAVKVLFPVCWEIKCLVLICMSWCLSSFHVYWSFSFSHLWLCLWSLSIFLGYFCLSC